MNLQGKKIVVIGGAGLIGSHTVDELVREDVKEILIYDNMTRGSKCNLNNALKDKRVKIYDVGGDILQNDILESALEKADGVFHFAALWLLQCHEYPRSAFDVNIKGTFNVMDACVKKKVKRLVYSSSASVYGDAVYNPMDENHPFNNKNFYGATKIACEALLRSYHFRYNLKYVGLRYMNVYGPRQDYHGAYVAVIMKMLDAIDKGKSPIIYGDGSESFDFIHVIDCARANIFAMQSKYNGEYYNIGTGIQTSLKQIAEKLLKIKKSNLKIEYKKRISNTFVKNRIGSITKAKKELDFKSEILLEDGLKSLIEWRDIDKKS